MATAFSENEKGLIRENLKNAAKECLGTFGIKKTTVDQLVKMAGISKGAFYIFYPSKEILFFTILEEYQTSIFNEFLNNFNNVNKIGIQEFTDIIYALYQELRHSFIMNIIQNQEFEYFMRKIPEKFILDHHSFDDLLARNLLSHLKVKNNIQVEILAASLRAIFMTMLHVKEIGEKDYDKVLRLLIMGIAQQLIEEGNRDE